MNMKSLLFEAGETVKLEYQIKDSVTGHAVDITGMSFKFAAKKKHTMDDYRIVPVDGTIDDAVEGKFSFEVLMPSTPFSGVYSVVMEDGDGKRTVLTQRGGAAISVIESLVD